MRGARRTSPDGIGISGKHWFSASAENGIHNEKPSTCPQGNGEPHRGSERSAISFNIIHTVRASVEGCRGRLHCLRTDIWTGQS